MDDSAYDPGNQHDRDEPDGQGRSTPYYLRTRKSVSYTYKALPIGIPTQDEPKLKESLRSHEEDKWIDAIDDEFKPLHEAKTSDPYDGPK